MSRFFQGRQVYVGASKLIYFSEADPHHRLAADLIVAIDPPLGTGPRGAWLTWREGKAPDLVIEIDQPRHLRPDSAARQSAYADAGVAEYLVYNPRAHAPSPPVQAEIGPPAPRETKAGICSWYSPALDCHLHTIRGIPAITPTSDNTPPYDAASYHTARQNIIAELAHLHQQIAACYDNIADCNRWLHNPDNHGRPAGAPNR